MFLEEHPLIPNPHSLFQVRNKIIATEEQSKSWLNNLIVGNCTDTFQVRTLYLRSTLAINMFWEHQEPYALSTESSCPSFRDVNSCNSFCSETTDAGSDIMTPPSSTRRASLDSAKFDELKFDEMAFDNVHTPQRHVQSNSMSSTSSSHNFGSGYMANNMMFHNTPVIRDQGMCYSTVDNFGSFVSNHRLSESTPSLDMDLSSPVSCMDSYPGTMSFVNPLQTTFIKSFDPNSPMRPLQFTSPISNCNEEMAFDLSPTSNLSMHLKYEQYDECRSEMSTPSRSSTSSYRSSTMRQPMELPIRSSAALQQVQSQPSNLRRTDRNKLNRRIKREMHPEIHRKADYCCTALLKDGTPCERKFVRSEHLKRHERIHFSEDRFECLFCEKEPSVKEPKTFNRLDNLKAHIARHMNPEQEKRTKYHPGAREVWEAMDRMKKGKAERAVKKEVMRSKTRPSRGMVY
jgi:hypothetical protein